jgi:hypothetical protein
MISRFATVLLMLCATPLSLSAQPSAARTPSEPTITDYYPQSGSIGSRVTVHVSGMDRVKPPRAPEALHLFLDGHLIPDSKPIEISVPSGKVVFELGSTDAAKSTIESLSRVGRVELSVGWNMVPLEATAEPLTEQDKMEGSRKFRLEPTVIRFLPSRGGIGTVVTFYVTGLRMMKPPATADNLRLFIDGHPMLDSRPTVDARNETVSFRLLYTEAAAEAWGTRLGWGSVPITVGWEKEGALPVTGGERNFEMTPGSLRVAIFVVLFVALLGTFAYLGIATNLLRNSELSTSVPAGGPYAFSLGRCQMAWWTFIVLGACFFMWLVTGRLIVTPSLLVLLGISAGTGLGAVIVDATKQSGSISAAAQAADAAQAQATAVATQAQAAPSASLSAAASAVQQSASELQNAARLQTQRAAQLARGAAPPSSKGNFFRDILSDENGISFHRFQVLAWSLFLGIYFIFEVLSRFEMPKVPDEFLTLMGISGSTYIGFKFPERRT